MNDVKSWSFSRWELYELCPAKFKFRHIEKLPEPDSPAMARGNEIHALAAARLTSETPAPLTSELAQFAATFGALGAIRERAERDGTRMYVEEKWAFTEDMTPVDWFDSSVWLRTILDVGLIYADHTADIIDWKTGKPRPENVAQMEVFGMSVMAMFPGLTNVTARLCYLDYGQEVKKEYSASEYSALVERWRRHVEPMFRDKTFAPRPNPKCMWCAYSRSNNGPCRFG